MVQSEAKKWPSGQHSAATLYNHNQILNMKAFSKSLNSSFVLVIVAKIILILSHKIICLTWLVVGLASIIHCIYVEVTNVKPFIDNNSNFTINPPQTH